jgi:hypothetical protein
MSQVWLHYLLQQQVVSDVIGSTGKFRSASEPDIAVVVTGVYDTDSGSPCSDIYSTVPIRDLVEEPAGAGGQPALLSTQPTKSHYRLDEDGRLVRVPFSPLFTVLRQISKTP